MSATALEAPAAGPDGADGAAVRNLADRVAAAWNAADAEAFAAVFTEDATLVGDLFMVGRDAIATAMAAGFEGPFRGTTLSVTPVDLRFVRPDVAILLTRGVVRPAGLPADGPAGGFLATTTAVRAADGRWEIAAYQNAKGGGAADAPAAPEEDRT